MWRQADVARRALQVCFGPEAVILDRGCPSAVYVRRFVIAWPRRHGYADEFERTGADVSILKRRTYRYVDGDAGNKPSHSFLRSIFAPYFPLSFKHMPELTNGRMNRSTVDLPPWDCAVDHVARCAIHDEANIGPCGGLGIWLRRQGCFFQDASPL